MTAPVGYLDLYDYRLDVAAMYRERNGALDAGEDPSAVLARFRVRRDRIFSTHPQSALPPEQQSAFERLSYYPYNPNARVEATLDTDVSPERLDVVTSGSEMMPMERTGVARFSLGGQALSLSVYWIDVYGGGLFLPFRDATSGNETYGGGRYLFDTVKGSDFTILSRDPGRWRIVLDFNYAYNPSCAYDPRWVCPLAPRENWLPIPIHAGERAYERH